MTTPDEPLVTTATVDEVITAIEAVDLAAPWEDVAPNLRLALPRRRPLPADTAALPQRQLGPGIDCVLGLDIGPAMLFVTHEQLSGWGISAGTAFDRALANLRERVAARKQFALMCEQIADVPTVAFQSREGWASSLLLVPDALVRVLGRRDGLVIAPMRDLVLCLPLDVEREFAHWLLDEFAGLDMNALALPPFALVDGHLSRAIGVPPALRRSTRAH